MSMEKTIGGDRLGSGKKMKVHLHNYERSTHDLSYVWRSSMSAGTLVPFMKQLALPGDTFDIDLQCEVLTLPTVGPLFGSYKVQLDIFLAPIRLYNAKLHNNTLGIGMNMSSVTLPQITLKGEQEEHISTSNLLAYLGIRGAGYSDNGAQRNFNAVPILAYWEIYKQYYSNKQEGVGAYINSDSAEVSRQVQGITIDAAEFPQAPSTGTVTVNATSLIALEYQFAPQDLSQIIINTTAGAFTLDQLVINVVDSAPIQSMSLNPVFGTQTWLNWAYTPADSVKVTAPEVTFFPLENIDSAREWVLSNWDSTVNIGDLLPPYNKLTISNQAALRNIQHGLALKTYQSDLFNNWLKEDWQSQISAITAVSTAIGDSFTIDTLNLSRKVYDMLNRIAISGGTYDDWIDAVYSHDRFLRAEMPMYCGGLIKELVFQEVVSNTQTEEQPLGTLAGRGRLTSKHKGGNIYVKVDEPSYIIGIVSLTPRIDYSQGNDWDVNLKSMDDFHKPALDQIGFQDLITEQMAWWSTHHTGTAWEQQSAGRQPAWINYMTNINRTYGSFAMPDDSMFMTLNRRYERPEITGFQIVDLTTYIDPAKYNFIFADTRLDAMNFWVQIGSGITARRKMSAKIMPNL